MQIEVEPKVVILINSIANGAYNNNGPGFAGPAFYYGCLNIRKRYLWHTIMTMLLNMCGRYL